MATEGRKKSPRERKNGASRETWMKDKKVGRSKQIWTGERWEKVK